MKLEIYCNNELMNVVEDNQSVHASLTAMLYSVAAKNTQDVTKMKGDYRLEDADLSFYMPEQNFGTYIYKFINVPIVHELMNTYLLIHPKED